MADIEKGSWHPVVIMSGTCALKGQFFQPLIDQGLTGKDTYTILNLKDPLDPANANDPFIQTYMDVMKKAGLDPTKSTYFTGLDLRVVHDRDPEGGGQLQGRPEPGQHHAGGPGHPADNPALFTGLTSKMNGLKDAYLIEGGQMVKYTVTDPKKLGDFVPDGRLINNEGKLGTYATVASIG